jgi:hypothetical protein
MEMAPGWENHYENITVRNLPFSAPLVYDCSKEAEIVSKMYVTCPQELGGRITETTQNVTV